MSSIYDATSVRALFNRESECLTESTCVSFNGGLSGTTPRRTHWTRAGCPFVIQVCFTDADLAPVLILIF
jgi:hypothetical protein